MFLDTVLAQLDYGALEDEVNRREFLAATGATALELALETPSSIVPIPARAEAKPDFTIRIGKINLELAPGKVIETTGYNGRAPGPVLRMREGQRVTVNVVNDTDVPELVHWHGQFVPPEADGVEEEGTPFVPAHGHRRFTFVPGPSGSRWYHTHVMAGPDLGRSTYTGQFGFVYVEPKNEPGRYDQEIFLAAHHWEPSLAHMGPPNNGWEIAYNSCSFNDKALGHGDPIRVRQGQRVLFHFLNASATEDIRIALPGHRFRVVALDGNPVPTKAIVEALQIAVAERVDAVVEMNQPGVWVMGSASDEVRGKGMGIVVEYAGHKGEPRWVAPERTPWDYTIFGSQVKPPEPDVRHELTFQKIPGQRVTFNRWTINGKSFPDTDPIFVVAGKRYRLLFHNKNGDSHPIHLHRHNFEIVSIGGKPTAGIIKDIVNVPRFSDAEVDFVADHPGLSLFHCHMQLHMDFGFKTLVKYS
jgi:FtsP/CotA-like multicopper oxidase with cupredoxin domain